MNKIKTWALAALVGIAATGCDDTLMENVNPDAAHQNTCELGLPVLIFYASQVNYDHAEYGIYLSQCLTTTGRSQTGSYAYKSGWQFLTMNRHPQWRRHFFDIGKNTNDLLANSEAAGSPNYALIARTIRLMSTQLTTDMFGDMPRSEAYLSNSPHYDTQASIYNWMLNEEIPELLSMYEDPAITEASGNKTIDVTQDRIYAGDLQKWKGLVYALRARLLLRNIPNVNTSTAMCDQIIAAAQQAIDQWRKGDLLYGAWFGNEPRYNFDGGITESNAQWSSSMPKINNWESRSNDLNTAVPSRFFMEDCLGIINQGIENSQGYWDRENGYGADPRLLTMMKPNEGPISASNPSKRVMYRYLENNIGGGSTFKQANYPDLFKGAYAGGTDAYTPLFTMEELYFIQAEAYYWKGDKAKACALVREATENNCQRHLDRFLRDNGGAYPKAGCPHRLLRQRGCKALQTRRADRQQALVLQPVGLYPVRPDDPEVHRHVHAARAVDRHAPLPLLQQPQRLRRWPQQGNRLSHPASSLQPLLGILGRRPQRGREGELLDTAYQLRPRDRGEVQPGRTGAPGCVKEPPVAAQAHDLGPGSRRLHLAHSGISPRNLII